MAKKARGAGGTPATVALTGRGHRVRACAPTSTTRGRRRTGWRRPRRSASTPPGSSRRCWPSLDGSLVVGIVPVTGQLDLKALARALGGSKAVMAEVAAAERATGYVAGGISPVGQKRRHPTVLDDSALEHDTILVSGGRRGFDLELAPADLVAITGAVTATIGR